MLRGNLINVKKENNKQNLKSEDEVNKKKAVKSEPIDLKSLNIDNLEFWPKIIEKLKEEGKMAIAFNLMGTIATLINDMTVGIIFQNGLTPFVRGVMEKPENMQELVKLVSIECGKEMRVKILDSNDNIVKQKIKEAQNPIKDLGVIVNEIDD